MIWFVEIVVGAVPATQEQPNHLETTSMTKTIHTLNLRDRGLASIVYFNVSSTNVKVVYRWTIGLTRHQKVYHMDLARARREWSRLSRINHVA